MSVRCLCVRACCHSGRHSAFLLHRHHPASAAWPATPAGLPPLATATARTASSGSSGPSSELNGAACPVGQPAAEPGSSSHGGIDSGAHSECTARHAATHQGFPQSVALSQRVLTHVWVTPLLRCLAGTGTMSRATTMSTPTEPAIAVRCSRTGPASLQSATSLLS